MTTAYIENGIININGRATRIARRISNLRVDRPGRIVGTASGHEFVIYGGRAMGGSRSDWFLTWSPIGAPDMPIKSIADGINLVETA